MRANSPLLVFSCFVAFVCVWIVDAEGEVAKPLLRNLAKKSKAASRGSLDDFLTGLTRCQIMEQIDELMPQLQIAQQILDPDEFLEKSKRTYDFLVAAKEKKMKSSSRRHLSSFPHDSYVGYRFHGNTIVRECEFREEIDDLMDKLYAARKLEDTKMFQETAARIKLSLVAAKRKNKKN